MTTVKVERAPVGLRFWVLWMLATTLGLLAYIVLSFPLSVVSRALGAGTEEAIPIISSRG